MMKSRIFLLIIGLLLVLSCSTSDDNINERDELVVTVDELMGSFQNGAHPTSGTATVNPQRTSLTFSNFMTDDGPILEVYLCGSSGNCDSYITLGVLKNITGDQEYTLPANVNFETHNYVHIWCVEFAVSFGHAKLE